MGHRALTFYVVLFLCFPLRVCVGWYQIRTVARRKWADANDSFCQIKDKQNNKVMKQPWEVMARAVSILVLNWSGVCFFGLCQIY